MFTAEIVTKSCTRRVYTISLNLLVVLNLPPRFNMVSARVGNPMDPWNAFTKWDIPSHAHLWFQLQIFRVSNSIVDSVIASPLSTHPVDFWCSRICCFWQTARSILYKLKVPVLLSIHTYLNGNICMWVEYHLSLHNSRVAHPSCRPRRQASIQRALRRTFGFLQPSWSMTSRQLHV